MTRPDQYGTYCVGYPTERLKKLLSLQPIIDIHSWDNMSIKKLKAIPKRIAFLILNDTEQS